MVDVGTHAGGGGGGGGGGGAAQVTAGDALLRGAGAPALKSARVSLVSVQPAPARERGRRRREALHGAVGALEEVRRAVADEVDDPRPG